jgi:hypothetical protein
MGNEKERRKERYVKFRQPLLNEPRGAHERGRDEKDEHAVDDVYEKIYSVITGHVKAAGPVVQGKGKVVRYLVSAARSSLTRAPGSNR